ncbi:Uncharacterised protein [Mycobacteroides abscessus subsp. abscessus]|nr:Uncharacterised protein [Mycobacteroides abscessus subsp. abscessus]SIL28092.1 Uncharacterised protein [Mycobacteroides abscessus subsp. abscessus]SLJ64675.1 Uncharacterised protein [Mycobacteroides abscessus subsp. abscessus]
MDATVGLQISQPVPLPCLAMSSEKVRIPVACTTWNSSARDCSKCSHSALDCSTPWAARICLSMGMQLPQEVPAQVAAFRAGTSVAPSQMAAQIAPLVTALHEQICASSGSAPTPISAPDGAMSEAGSAGSSLPSMGRRVP